MNAMRRRMTAILVLAPAILCALRLAGVWTCTTACAGGGQYERLVGVPILVPGLMVYLALAALVWRDLRRGSWQDPTVVAAWLLAGVSLFFVSILVRLGLWCPHCIAVHVLIAVLVALLGPVVLPWRWRALALLLGFLLANAAFHHQPVLDVAEPEHRPASSAAATVPAGIQATVEANRSLGDLLAPWRLDLAIDHYCPHCAEEHAGLMRALAPLAGGRLRIVTRHVLRPSTPRGAELARYALAAAAVDRPTFTALTALLLGTRHNLGWSGVRSQVADVLDATAIEALELRHREVLAGMVQQDQRELRERGIGATTPALALVAVADGRTVRLWTGAGDARRIAGEVAELIAR